MAGNFVSRDTEFKEVNITIRHYSNMRFLAMPIFFTINGAILLGLKDENIRDIPNLYWAIAIFSVVLFLFFASYEWRLHSYLEKFVAHVRTLKPDCFWSKRPDRRIVVTFFVILLYASVVLFWFFLAYSISPAAHVQCT